MAMDRSVGSETFIYALGKEVVDHSEAWKQAMSFYVHLHCMTLRDQGWSLQDDGGVE